MELVAGPTRLVVDEAAGGRLASLLVPVGPGGGSAGAAGAARTVDLVGSYRPTAHGWGAFPMAPWAGRVRHGELTWRGRTHRLPVTKPPHAIHGLVSDVPWEVVEHDGSRAVLRRDVGPQWPWPAHAVLRHDLSPSSLTTVLEVHADGPAGAAAGAAAGGGADGEQPAWCGLHAWHPRHLPGPGGEPVAVQVDLSAAALLVRDDEGVPDGRERPLAPGEPLDPPVDDTVRAPRWPVVLRWPGVVALEVTADTGWAVVFTEREEAVALEPQTAPPDATALGAEQVVRPGEPLVMTTTWRWAPA